MRSCFWKNSAKDQALQHASTAAGGRFVDISALAGDESNYARSERPFKNAGVANHRRRAAGSAREKVERTLDGKPSFADRFASKKTAVDRSLSAADLKMKPA